MSTGSLSDERAREPEEETSLVCKDCPMWYGEEDKGWGPCSIKHQRGAVQFITFGGHQCDESYRPPENIRGPEELRQVHAARRAPRKQVHPVAPRSGGR